MKTRILFFSFLLLSIQTHAQLYTFKNFSHREGLHMGAVNCMGQSDDGYLWLGTDGASLVRFDGKNFEEVEFKTADNNHHFQSIDFDGTDILFSSAYKGFFRYSRETGTISRMLTPKHKIGDKKDVFRHQNGTYFIGNLGIVYSEEKIEKIVKKFNLKGSLKIFQRIDLGDKIILLTSKGNFFLANGTVNNLRDWIEISLKSSERLKFGYFDDDKLTLFDEKGEHWVEAVLNKKGKLYSINEYQNDMHLPADDPAIAFNFNRASRACILLTAKSELYTLAEQKRELEYIAHNLADPFRSPEGVYTDLNGNYWVNSSIKGIYKISEDAFTGVQLNPLLQSDDISFPYRTSDNRAFVSRFNGKTYVLENSAAQEFETYDFQLYGVAKQGGKYYFASDKGIKRYQPNKPVNFESVIDPGNSISFIFANDDNLWYGIRSKGLIRYNTETKEKTIFNNLHDLPNYIYTAQTSNDNKFIYFGSNSGVFAYNKSKETFSHVAYNGQFGSYSGVSAKDTFGNIWFTLEKGLLVITTESVKVIRSDKYLPTNLLYTLNGDMHGNIIIGTNKGITLLNVDADGNVKRSTTYDSESGFMGYEAHMRSQFQSDNNIFIGTVEGLFAIDTRLIENLGVPLRPLIFDISSEGLEVGMTKDPDAFRFRFQVNNPKNENIIYRYRIKERGLDWQYLSDDNVIQITGLSNGTYTLEVESSYDGNTFSESSFHHFNIHRPFWKTTWFLIALIALVVLINIFLLTYGKKYDSSKFLSTKDTEVVLSMTPATLLFATIIVPCSQLFAKALYPEFSLNLGGTLIIGFLLLGLYLISLNAQKTGQTHQFKYLLTVALYLATGFFIWETYRTHIHPFHLIAVILLTAISPYTLSKVRSTIIYALLLFSALSVILILVEDAIYPKLYAGIGVFCAVSVMIFNSYLRYNSLEKLLFVSGIINHGNFPVVAYRRDGSVTYVSENINKFIDVDHKELLNSNISLLNKFSLFDETYKNVDVTNGLKEGDKYLTPMTDSQQGVSWMEWSYQKFSENNHVIIGQDVSERIELQNTYELLVQNVEDLIYTVDVKGNFVFVNKALTEKLEYTKEELIDMFSVEFVDEEYQARIQEFYEDHFSQGKDTSYSELPIRSKSGEVIWIGQHVNTIYAPGSKSYVNGYIALARDITEIRKQQQLIKTQRDDITSSINYARKIQLNLLPHEQHFAEYFACHFILYRPKDIVSGDFYWVQRLGDKLVVVLADCTGHGVPGAFMTLLGLNMLNSIVLDAQLAEPGMILNELEKRLEDYFQKQIATEKMNDGMELTVCVIDKNQKDISYACAGSRFLIHGDNGFTMFKGNNEHIGDAKPEEFPGYITHYTSFGEEETLYLFSDGFQDQFGGVNNKKFSFRRLLELFESNINMQLPEQRKMIESEFDAWRGEHPQTDDVAVIGLRRKDV